MNGIDEFNKQALESQGIKSAVRSEKIVRSVGDLQEARLGDGTVIKRQEFIFTEQDGLVKCAPYELHFIYEMPKDKKGWGLMCTCGSIAGVVGLNAYSKLASPTNTGKMIVCVRHTTLKQNTGIGEHADGSHE